MELFSGKKTKNLILDHLIEILLLVLIIAHFISSFPYAPQMTAAQADEAATIAIMAAKQVFIPVTIIFIKFLAITEYKLYNSITE